MRLYVLRHACAGRKEEWPSPDEDRPLDHIGRVQASAVAEVFVEAAVNRLVSSPVARCVDTLRPLSRQLSVPIERDARLAPAPGARLGRFFVDPTFADAILCTHGEVMTPLLRELQQQGVPIISERLDDAWLLAKGTAWVLDLNPDGSCARLDHRAPLGLQTCSDHRRDEA